MRIQKPNRKEIFVFIAILVLGVSTIFLILLPKENTFPKIFLYTLLSGITCFFFGWFLKTHTILDFFKVLLPTSLSILTFTWLLSSGYLNLQKANLKFEINKFEERKDTLESQIEQLTKSDKIKQWKLDIKDSLLKNKQDELELLNLEIDKIIGSNKEKEQLINRQRELNKEQDKLIKQYTDRISSSNHHIVELISIDPFSDTFEIIIELYDNNLNLLNDTNIDLVGSHNLPQNFIFNHNSKKFECKILIASDEHFYYFRYKKLPEDQYLNKHKFHVYGSIKTEDPDKARQYSIDLPFASAEYKIILK